VLVSVNAPDPPIPATKLLLVGPVGLLKASVTLVIGLKNAELLNVDPSKFVCPKYDVS